MDKVNKSLRTQLNKYGGAEGYREEMRRRRKLVKRPGFSNMDPDKRREAARKGGINAGINFRKKVGKDAGKEIQGE